MIRKYAEIFCWKNVSSFCTAKATHIFSAKNIRILYIESAKTVNEMTLNELVKLTTLWTTGPWSFRWKQSPVNGNTLDKGLFEAKSTAIYLFIFFLFLHETVCCRYLWSQGLLMSITYFMEKYLKIPVLIWVLVVCRSLETYFLKAHMGKW